MVKMDDLVVVAAVERDSNGKACLVVGQTLE
jgi:hypothetical protein